MQVFLPYEGYYKSVYVLDFSRAGNQIYREAKTLVSGGWPHHPASKMWLGYEWSLCDYALKGLQALKDRGRDYPKWFEWFGNEQLKFEDTGKPLWLGLPTFHLSHQSNLIRKDPNYYRPIFGPDVPDDLEYFWPTKNGY